MDQQTAMPASGQTWMFREQQLQIRPLPATVTKADQNWVHYRLGASKLSMPLFAFVKIYKRQDD